MKLLNILNLFPLLIVFVGFEVCAEETKSQKPTGSDSMQGSTEDNIIINWMNNLTAEPEPNPITAEDQFDLANSYFYGKGLVFQDVEEAIKWYTKAAEQGYISAQLKLAYLHFHGQVVSQDYREAAKWYAKAAGQGDAEGQYYLSKMYINGQGVPKDYMEAVKWMTKAAEQGFPHAQLLLINTYAEGKIVPQDYKKAAEWLTKVAELGHAPSQYWLGGMYYHGQGVSKNYSEAAKWFAKASELGYPMAQHWLGTMYFTGEGVPKDYNEAMKLMTKAAEGGVVETFKVLGQVYRAGVMESFYDPDRRASVRRIHIPKDNVQAYKWFIIAAMNGDEKAKEILNTLATEMSSKEIDEAKDLAVEWLEKHQEKK